jgi:hypothetical protein
VSDYTQKVYYDEQPILVGTIIEYPNIIYRQVNTDGRAVYGVVLSPLDRGFESR